jgi:G:T-mismatch repair DNA endonuclease (very short patch repair protein)
LEKKEGIPIQHAGKGPEKEFVVDGSRYIVDGYVPEQNRVIEVLGDYVHGCLKCHKGWEPMINKESATWNNQKQIARRHTLEGLGLQVDEIWECEIKAMLKKDAEMKEFFQNEPEIGRLNPRDAYTGGRTGIIQLFCICIS